MIVKGRYYIPNFVKGNVAFQSPAYEFATYDICVSLFNSFPASGDFCRLLIIFANSFDPDQDRQDVGPDLDPNCLTLTVFLKDFFLKIILKKSQLTTTKV